MVLKDDDILWATGSNLYGQLGDGSKISKDAYVRLSLSLDGVEHGDVDIQDLKYAFLLGISKLLTSEI